MVLLVGSLLVVLALWWIWWRDEPRAASRGHGRRVAFGLALERSLDVVGAARADAGRPAEPRVRRDVGGPP